MPISVALRKMVSQFPGSSLLRHLLGERGRNAWRELILGIVEQPASICPKALLLLSDRSRATHLGDFNLRHLTAMIGRWRGSIRGLQGLDLVPSDHVVRLDKPLDPNCIDDESKPQQRANGLVYRGRIEPTGAAEEAGCAVEVGLYGVAVARARA